MNQRRVGIAGLLLITVGLVLIISSLCQKEERDDKTKAAQHLSKFLQELPSSVLVPDPQHPTTLSSLQASDEHPDAAYVHSLDEPAVAMPLEMARDVARVWIGCEIRGRLEKDPYTNLAAIVGELGERGQAQVHPIHRAGMEKQGLDYYGSEGDRIFYAVQVWERSGWNPWGDCRP